MSRSKKEQERKSLTKNGEKRSLSFLDQLSRSMSSIVSAMLLDLATDEAGKLVFSVRNIQGANRIGTTIQSAWQRESLNFSQRIVRGLLRLFRVNTEYFKAVDTPRILTENVETRVLRLLMQRYGYDTNKNMVIRNGYLAANLRNNGHAASVAQRINQAIAGKVSLKAFIRDFRQDFSNPGSPLSAKHHYNRFARDLFAEFDRNVQNEYAEQLGLSHAIYSGTEKNNTRDFCADRLNRIFTAEKIDSWDSLTWKGKKPGVPVREALGGYNCRHTLSWISAETAEQLAKRRGIEIDTMN